MTSQACANISDSLGISTTQLMQNLQEHERVLDNSVRILPEYLAETLQPTSFIVDTQNKTKAVAPVNKYITSKPDLLIYNSHFSSLPRSSVH